MKNHTCHAGRTDKPIAGLLKDLKRRGLLDETLVIWGGEFGRHRPPSSDGTGRDHNAYGFTMWLAGGGIKGGSRSARPTKSAPPPWSIGYTSRTCTPRCLTQLGFDPNKLTYFYSGLDQKLVGVEGAEPIRQII